MAPRSLTTAEANRFDRVRETADMLETLDTHLFYLCYRLQRVGRSATADLLYARLWSLAHAARTLAHIVHVTDRESKTLCPHFVAALQRRHHKPEEAAAAAAATAATFPQFARLPAELRLMIWEAAAEPLPCLQLFSLLEAARKPSRAEQKKGLVHMQGAHHLDAAGVLLLSDRGLWQACAESRHEVQRVHARARQRLLASSYPGLGCHLINPLDLDDPEKHGRRMNRLNRAALKYASVANSVYRSCWNIVRAEHALRKEPVAQTKTQEEVGYTPLQREQAQRPPSAILQDLLRYLFALDGDLPQGADDGPIPEAALGSFRKDLQLRHLLGIGD